MKKNAFSRNPENFGQFEDAVQTMLKRNLTPAESEILLAMFNSAMATERLQKDLLVYYHERMANAQMHREAMARLSVAAGRGMIHG